MPPAGGLCLAYAVAVMESIHITDLEAAINYWRDRSPAGTGSALAPATTHLAEVYAGMICAKTTAIAIKDLPDAALQAWLAWYDTQPDTPCIAICSTSQGDDQCKGCGRSFDEVQHWPAMTPAEKRVTWRSITMEDSAWRLNRYAERAREAEPPQWPDDDPAVPTGPEDAS